MATPLTALALLIVVVHGLRDDGRAAFAGAGYPPALFASLRQDLRNTLYR